MTLDEAVTEIKEKYARQDIIDLAAARLYGKDGAINTVLYPVSSEMGVVGVVIRGLLYDRTQHLGGTLKMVAHLKEHYQIPSGFVPAVPVFHEALGLVVQLKRVLSLLFTDPEMVGACHRFMTSPSWAGVLSRLISVMMTDADVVLPDNPGDVNLMSPAEVDAILRLVVSLPQAGVRK
jgi:hypothetical protein